VHRLGVVSYAEAWQLQARLAAAIAAGERPPGLLLLEHPHTYTFGRSGHLENLLWDQEQLARRGVSVHWVDRGGDVTYHGPGQLVGYPLLQLAPPGQLLGTGSGKARLPQTDYVGYLRRLEDVLIKALARLGVRGERIDRLTGVWVPPAKIAAIGVKVDVHGVSQHGFALNVNPDMTYWQGIIGCGLKDAPVTSLAALLPVPPDMPTVMDAVVEAFGETFGFEMIEAGGV
jgi:lipoyl(octanoyl) transferase